MTWLTGLLLALIACQCLAIRPDDCPVKECPEECPKLGNCTEGPAYDYRFCECCPVCAKVEGEVCGGRFHEEGTCAKGLFCSTDSKGVSTCQKRRCPPAPAKLVGCTLLPNTCNDDSDCDDETHCCFDGCRRRCRDPSEKFNSNHFGKRKPGKCPALPKPEFCAADVDECHFDWDCNGNKKCCGNGCNKQCVLPGTAAGVLAPKCKPPPSRSSCPPHLRSSCDDDDECHENVPSTICCFDGCRRICVFPNGTTSGGGAAFKPGSCPFMNPPAACAPDHDQCVVDGHCFQNKKCCSNDCFKECVAPADPNAPGTIVLPSQCPNVTRPGSCHVGLAHTCVANEDCVEGTFCCSDGCRRRCFDPQGNAAGGGVEKAGECPAPTDLPTPEYCPSDVDECQIDYDCSQDRKCCSNGCYKMCVSPNLSVGAAYKCPLVTESYQCHDGFKHLCETDEECRVGGEFCCFDGCRRRCQAPRGSPASKPADGISVSCKDDGMRIDIEKDKLNGVKIFDLHLTDPNCKATSNSSHYSLETTLVGCGTSSRYTSKFVVYSNEAIQKSGNGESIITRNTDLTIPFACFYGKEGVTSTYGLKPRHKATVTMDGGDTETRFTLDLTLFHDKEYQKPYGVDEYPVPVTIDEPLYVQASADIKDKWLEVTADMCYATPTSNRDDAMKYYLIRNGCQQDATVLFYQAKSTQFRFSFDAFKFVGEPSSFLYLHCHMFVCNVSNPESRCSIGCLQEPRKRRAVQDADAQLSQGPFILLNDEAKPAKQVAQGAFSNQIMWVVVAMGAFCALCLLAVVYLKLKRKSPSPDPDRETYL